MRDCCFLAIRRCHFDLQREDEMVPRTIAKIFSYCFLLTQTLVQVQCQCAGSTLTLTADTSIQSFKTPDYETTGYPVNSDCSWLIQAPATYRISIQVLNIDAPCDSVAIVIHDGSTDADSVLGPDPICASGGNSSIFASTGEDVLVIFTSIAANGQGAEVYYLAGKDLSGTGCTSPETLSSTRSLEVLTSPNFPAEYDNDASCIWTVNAHNSATQLELVLLLTDIEVSNTDPSCPYDGLEIFDGATTADALLTNKICAEGRIAARTYTSTGTSVTLNFTSDNAFALMGFLLTYKSIGQAATTTNAVDTTTPATTTTEVTDNTALITMIVCIGVIVPVVGFVVLFIILKVKGYL